MNNVYPVTSTRRRKGAARGRESNVLHSPYETCTWFFKTMTSKVAILLYVAIFSVLGQQANAQCVGTVTLTATSTAVCTFGSTNTNTVSFVVEGDQSLVGYTITLYRNGSAVSLISSAATATVTITDPNAPPGTWGYDVLVNKTGCPNVQTAPSALQVTVYGRPVVTDITDMNGVSVAGGTQTICSGDAANFNVVVAGPVTGTITVNVTSSVATFSQTVAAAASGTTVVAFTVTPTTNTTYTVSTVTTTGNNSCAAVVGTFTTDVNVSSPLPTLSVSNNLGTGNTACQGIAFQFQITNLSAIAGPYTITWYKDGNPIAGPSGSGATFSGQGTATLTVSNPQPGESGSYYAVVCSSDPQYAACSGGCGQSVPVNVVVNPKPTATFSPTSGTVCVNSNTQLAVNFTGSGPFDLVYNVSVNGGTASQASVSNVTSPYIITVPTSVAGATYSYTISQVVDNNCVNLSNASTAMITVSSFTFTPTVTTSPVCYGGTTSISVAAVQGNSGTVTYTLSNASGTLATRTSVGSFSGSYGAGTYTVSASNGGCVVNKSVVVGTYSQTTVSAVTTAAISCNGNTTSVTATVGGPAGTYTVTISSGTYSSTNTVVSAGSNTTTTFVGVPAGNYTISSTNQSTGCTVNSSLTILQPNPIVVTGTPGVANLSCFGGTTTIQASVTGGNAGTFTYTLSGGTTTGTLSSNSGSVTFMNVRAGTYTVSVVDSKGCTGSVTNIVISEPAEIQGNVSATNATCNGGSGEVTINHTAGGTGNVRYSLSGSLTGATAATSSPSYTFTGVAPGTYTATIIDANNCIKIVGNVTVTAPPAVTATLTAGQIQCAGGTTSVTISSIAGGNGGNIIFTLTNATGGTVTNTGFGNYIYPVSAGTYTITANNEGCPAQVIGSITVTEPAPIVVTTNATTITCVNGTSTVTISATAGTATLSYQLIDANTSVQFGSTVTNNTGSAVFSGVTPGTYNYVVTNVATGCVQQSTPGNSATQITIAPVSAVTLGTPVITDVTCFGGSNGTIAIRPAGGASGNYNVTAVGPNGYTRTLAGTSTVTFSGLFAGNYTITVVDGNGCSASSSVSATVGGGTASGTGAPDLILTSSASTNTFPTTGTTVSITYGVSNPSGNAATGVVLRVSKPTPDYTVELDPAATDWTHSGGTAEYEEFTFANQISCGVFTPIEVTVIVTRTAAAVGKGSFPVTGAVRSSVQDANESDNTRVDRLNAQ